MAAGAIRSRPQLPEIPRVAARGGPSLQDRRRREGLGLESVSRKSLRGAASSLPRCYSEPLLRAPAVGPGKLPALATRGDDSAKRHDAQLTPAELLFEDVYLKARRKVAEEAAKSRRGGVDIRLPLSSAEPLEERIRGNGVDQTSAWKPNGNRKGLWDPAAEEEALRGKVRQVIFERKEQLEGRRRRTQEEHISEASTSCSTPVPRGAYGLPPISADPLLDPRLPARPQISADPRLDRRPQPAPCPTPGERQERTLPRARSEDRPAVRIATGLGPAAPRDMEDLKRMYGSMRAMYGGLMRVEVPQRDDQELG